MFKDYKKLYTLGFVFVGLFLIILLVNVSCCFLFSEYLYENAWLFYIIVPLIIVSIIGLFAGIFILKKANKIKINQLLEEDKKDFNNIDKNN